MRDKKKNQMEVAREGLGVGGKEGRGVEERVWKGGVVRKFRAKVTAAESRERALSVFKMRLGGVTWREVAERHGFATIGEAVIAYKKAEVMGGVNEDVDMSKAMWLRRLDEAVAGLMPRVKKGNLVAVKAMLACCREYSNLKGMDAPKRVERYEKAEQATIREFVGRVGGMMGNKKGAQFNEATLRRLGGESEAAGGEEGVGGEGGVAMSSKSEGGAGDGGGESGGAGEGGDAERDGVEGVASGGGDVGIGGQMEASGASALSESKVG